MVETYHSRLFQTIAEEIIYVIYDCRLGIQNEEL